MAATPYHHHIRFKQHHAPFKRASPGKGAAKGADFEEDFSGAASDLIKEYTSKLQSVKTSGVLRQALGMGALTAAFLLLYFFLLRPRAKHYLAPRADRAQKLEDKIADDKWIAAIMKTKIVDKEESLGDKVEARLEERERSRAVDANRWWGRVKQGIKEAYYALFENEELHMVQSGLDSLVYLRLLWLNMTAFGVISVLVSPALAYIDWRAHNKKKLWGNVKIGKIELRDFTISGIEGKALYWHVLAAYIMTGVVCYGVYWNSLQIEKHRVEYLCNPAFLDFDADIYKRCIMIADIDEDDVKPPKKWVQSGKDGDSSQKKGNGEWKTAGRNNVERIVRGKIESIPHLKDKVHVTAVFQPVDPEGTEAWMKARNELVSHLQSTLTSYLRKQQEAEAHAAKKATAGETFRSKERPEFKIAPHGKWFDRTKVPALPWFKEAFVKLKQEPKIDQEKRERYAIVGFRCIGTASVFLQECASSTGKVRLNGWELDFAPTPSGIIWRNIGLLRGLRATSYTVGYVALAVLLLLYSFPLVFIALLSNVNAALSKLPWLKRQRDNSPVLFSVLTTTVPPLISAILFSLAPMLIELVAKFQGAKTVRALQHRTIHWYLAFLVLSQLVLLPCISTIWTIYVRDLDDAAGQKEKTHWLLKLWIDVVFFFSQIPATYQAQANYWLNWLALRWFTNALQLAQIGWLVQRVILGLVRWLTNRPQIKEAAPPDYSTRVPANMFLIILGLLYTPLVPFVPPFLMAGLMIQYGVHKIQAKLLYETIAETTGRFWLPEMDRLLLFLLLSNGCLALTCALQKADGKIALMIAPAGIAVICFRFYLRSRFNSTLLLMLHKNARVKTSFKENLTEQALKRVFGFAPRAIKFQLDNDIRVEGEKMLKESGLGPLITHDDQWMVDHKQIIKRPPSPVLASRGLPKVSKGVRRRVAQGAMVAKAVIKQQMRGKDAPPEPLS